MVELVVPGLDAWQIIVEGEQSFRFRARLDPGLAAPERDACLSRLHARLEAILAEKDMAPVRFRIEEVDSLAIDPRTGRFRLAVHETRESKDVPATQCAGGEPMPLRT